MALFRRKPQDTELPDLVTVLGEGHDAAVRLARMHAEDWGLGSADRWDVDLAAGTITWTFPDRTATAPVQIIGSYSVARTEWIWGWAMVNVPPPLRSAVEAVRAYGEAIGHDVLIADRVPGDGEIAGDLAAIALRVTRATGFYRSPVDPSTHCVFGDVTVTAADGTSRVVHVDVE